MHLVNIALGLCVVSAFVTDTAAFNPPTDPSHASSVLAIQDTINHYPLAIDSKNFQALSGVFTPDAVANYSAPLGVLTGLPSIESTLSSSLAAVMTQHALSTQVVTLLTESTANATTYFTATHFGEGVWTGQILTAYGRYEDVLVSTAKGWRINKRHLIYMGPLIGNDLIFVNS